MDCTDMTGRDTETGQVGLADPADARSNCGVGVVMDLDGGSSHEVVRDGLELVECMEHRGTTGAEKNTGDGAGILLQIPHEFFAGVIDAELPAPGEYAVGSLFLPQDDEAKADLKALVEEELAGLGEELSVHDIFEFGTGLIHFHAGLFQGAAAAGVAHFGIDL